MCNRVLPLFLVACLLAHSTPSVSSHKRHLLHSGRSGTSGRTHLWPQPQPFLDQSVYGTQGAIVGSSSSTPGDESPANYFFTYFDPVFNETRNTVLSAFPSGMPFQIEPFHRFSTAPSIEQASSTSIFEASPAQTSTPFSPSWPFPSLSRISDSDRDRATAADLAAESSTDSRGLASSPSMPNGPPVTSASVVSLTVPDRPSNQPESGSSDDPLEIMYPDLTQISLVRLIFLLLYLPVMIAAIIGNLLVCYTVLSNRKMQTVVHCYIVNLGLCDFLVGAFVLPSKMLELLAPNSWYLLNDALCTGMFFFQTLVVFASVLTLVASCFERYFAIVHPLKSRMQQSKRRTYRILVAVWVLSCVGSLPNFLSQPEATNFLLFSEYGSIERRSCIPHFKREYRVAYFTILFIAFYLIPLLLIAFTSFCIARSLLRTSVLRRQGSLLRQEVNRRKVGKMILVVVLSFTVSWTPYFLVSIITQYQEKNFMNVHDFYFTMLCINLFAFLHSAINPLIYAAMSTRFRKSFNQIIRRVLCCQKTPASNIIGQTSFNDPATSSRGSMVNAVNGTIKRFSQST